MAPLRRSCRHHHARRPDHDLTEPVATLVDLDHGTGLGALDRLLGDRLVQLGIEALALGREALDARHEGLCAVVGWVAVGGRHQLRGLKRAVEVVDRGQQFLGQLGDAALLGGRRLAGGPLAVVLKVGLGAPGELEILVGLLGLRGELLEVVLELALVVALGSLLTPTRGRGAHWGLWLAGRKRGHGGARMGRPLLANRLDSPFGGWLARHHFSSPTSASTTSSSSAPAPLVDEAPLPSACASAACSWARWYMASETLWNAVCSVSVLALMSAASSLVSDSRTALIACSISSFELESTASPRSLS